MIDPTEPIQPDEHNLANELKRLFARMKTEQLGQLYKPAARFQKPAIWIAAARKCLELKADPFDFLRATFIYCSIPGGPYPQQLATNAAVRWYRQYSKSTVKGENETLYNLEIQGLICSAINNLLAISQGQAKTSRQILLDDNLLPDYVAPAFIRVLLGPSDPAILEKYGRAARLEILSSPRLFKTLKDLHYDLTWMDTIKLA
jgi:hypothetical protein